MRTETWLFIGVYLPLMGLIWYSSWRNLQLKKIQDEAVSVIKGRHFWRINIAKPEFLKSVWKILPFQGKGVLIDEGEQLRIKGYWLKEKQHFEWVLNKEQAQAEWLDNGSLTSAKVYWASLSTGQQQVVFSSDTGLSAVSSRQALADIFRVAFPDVVLDESKTKGFALEKNWRSLGVALLFFAMVLGLLLNQLFNTRFEMIESQLIKLLTSPWVWMGALLTAGLTWYFVYRFLISGKVPARESWALSALMMGVTLVAALPIVTNLDRFFAQTPTQNYSYVLLDRYPRFEAEDKDKALPPLKFLRSSDYWQQFELGSKHPMPLLQGASGVWYLDHEKFDPPLLDFYAKQKEQ